MKLVQNQYMSLLDKFNSLQKDNAEKKSLGKHDYSLINALLDKNREVELHSNFIYSMINPNSTHYCGNIFLQLFLKAINEDDFINLSTARVYKEVGKIDLLIEDGERVIIIENKLKAVDQKHQISRYIKYCVENYLQENTDRYEDKIRIVYLSEYKEIPSDDTNSLYGFSLSNNKLIWNNLKDVYLHNSGHFNLPINTTLKFNRVQHSKELLNWINESTKWLKENRPYDASNGLMCAFKEYGLILKRLDTKKQWRNLMSLDEYTLLLKDKAQEEEEMMYAFMSEAYERFNEYLGKKLFQEIDKLFSNYGMQNCIIDGREFKEFTQENCIRWFKKWKTKDKYRDVAFQTKIKGKKFIFALGVSNIIYKTYDEEFEWKNPQFSRQNLQKNNQNNNLFTLLNDLKDNYS